MKRQSPTVSNTRKIRRHVHNRWDDRTLQQNLIFLQTTGNFLSILNLLKNTFTNTMVPVSTVKRYSAEEYFDAWQFPISNSKYMLPSNISETQIVDWKEYITRLCYVFERTPMDLIRSLPESTNLISTVEMLDKIFATDLLFCEEKIPNFKRVNVLCSAYVDDYHKCVLLGYSTPRKDNIKYCVVGSYYSTTPALVLLDRVQFKFSRVEQYCNHSCIVFWEGEATIEEFNDSFDVTTVSGTREHMFKVQLLELLSHMQESDCIVGIINEIITTPKWITYCSVPKPLDLIEEDIELLGLFITQDVLQQHKNVEDLILISSYLLGRVPQQVVAYFVEKELFSETVSSKKLFKQHSDILVARHALQEQTEVDIIIDDISLGTAASAIPMTNNADRTSFNYRCQHKKCTSQCKQSSYATSEKTLRGTIIKKAQSVLGSIEACLNSFEQSNDYMITKSKCAWSLTNSSDRSKKTTLSMTKGVWSVEATNDIPEAALVVVYKNGDFPYIAKNSTEYNCVRLVINTCDMKCTNAIFTTRKILQGEQLVLLDHDSVEYELFPPPITIQYSEDCDDAEDFEDSEEFDDSSGDEYIPTKTTRKKKTCKSTFEYVGQDMSKDQHIELLLDYLEERRRIEIKRLRNEPQPWTSDAILAKYHFCHIRREDDHISRILLKMMQPYCRPGKWDQNILANIIIHRWISQKDFTTHLGYIHNLTDAIKILYDREKKKLPIRTGAFTCSVPTWKIEETFKSAWKQGNIIQKIIEKKNMNMDSITKELNSNIYGIGIFLASQIVMDLVMYGMIPLEEQWICFGPGAISGLKMIQGSNDVSRATQVTKLVNRRLDQRREKRTNEDVLDAKDALQLRVIDLEHSLCEYYKYYKLKSGILTSGRKYHPSNGK